MRRPACGESGFALIELLVAALLTIVVAAAAATLLAVSSNSQARHQTYATTITVTQSALATLIHDLRGAVAVTSVGPGVIDFEIAVGTAGTTPTYYNVQYDCSAVDTLGAPYTRCARTQAVAPALPPAAGSTPGAQDIQHIYNNPTNTSAGSFNNFCNSGGTAPSGSVFFVSNPSIANTSGLGLACDEAYERVVSALPTYVQVRLQMPASGDAPRAGLTHFMVLQGGTFLPNLDVGS